MRKTRKYQRVGLLMRQCSRFIIVVAIRAAAVGAQKGGLCSSSSSGTIRCCHYCCVAREHRTPHGSCQAAAVLAVMVFLLRVVDLKTPQEPKGLPSVVVVVVVGSGGGGGMLLLLLSLSWQT